MSENPREDDSNFAFKMGGNADFKRKIAFCGALLNGFDSPVIISTSS